MRTPAKLFLSAAGIFGVGLAISLSGVGHSIAVAAPNMFVTGTVGIDPNANAVRVTSEPARQTVSLGCAVYGELGTSSLCTPSENSQLPPYVVPAGKRLVIDYVNVDGTTSSTDGTDPTPLLGRVNVGGVFPPDNVGRFLLVLAPERVIVRRDVADWTISASVTTFLPAGSKVYASMYDTSRKTLNDFFVVRVNGHLEDAI